MEECVWIWMNVCGCGRMCVDAPISS